MSKNHPASVILFFIDGLGIGEREQNNPLYLFENIEPLANFKNDQKEIIFDGILVATDPRLETEGRPQSASGQTTILTGINASKFLGNHKQGFPNEILREVIRENSVFLQLRRSRIDEIVFANAYTPQFFSEKQRWKSATTCAVETARIQLRKLPDSPGRKAPFQEFYESGFARKRL